jgi:hypothetical protein
VQAEHKKDQHGNTKCRVQISKFYAANNFSCVSNSNGHDIKSLL